MSRVSIDSYDVVCCNENDNENRLYFIELSLEVVMLPEI